MEASCHTIDQKAVFQWRDEVKHCLKLVGDFEDGLKTCTESRHESVLTWLVKAGVVWIFKVSSGSVLMTNLYRISLNNEHPTVIHCQEDMCNWPQEVSLRSRTQEP